MIIYHNTSGTSDCIFGDTDPYYIVRIEDDWDGVVRIEDDWDGVVRIEEVKIQKKKKFYSCINVPVPAKIGCINFTGMRNKTFVRRMMFHKSGYLPWRVRRKVKNG